MIIRTRYFLMAVGIAAGLMAVGCGGDGDDMSAGLQAQLDMEMSARAAAEGQLAELQEELETFRTAQMQRDQEEMMRQQEAQARRDAMAAAGLQGGLAQSPQASVWATSHQDALANLLPGGGTAFSPLSSAIRRYYPGTNQGVTQSDLGAAYVKSVSSDGEGGFHVNYVLDGEETLVHFAADQYDAMLSEFKNAMADTTFWLWSWTDSFSEPNGPDWTDGSTFFDYFDFHGWAYEGPGEGRRGSLAYGVRTMPNNMPMGNATYEGYMLAEWWEADNPNWGRRQQFIGGALTLEANLEDMELSGRIDGIHIPSWWTDSGENEPWDAGNSIDIATTAIDQTGFNADWVGNGPMDAAPGETLHGFTGTILGEFYGPEAEEVGGVLSGRRATMGTAPEQLIVGGFGAAQPDPEQ